MSPKIKEILSVIVFGSIACSTKAEDLLGKHLEFLALFKPNYGTSPSKYVINITSTGEVFMFSRSWTCKNITADNLVGIESVLGGTKSYSYTCIQSTPQLHEATSSAIWSGNELQIETHEKITWKGVGADLNQTWHINVSGSSCSGSMSEISKGVKSTMIISSCSVGTGLVK